MAITEKEMETLQVSGASSTNVMVRA